MTVPAASPVFQSTAAATSILVRAASVWYATCLRGIWGYPYNLPFSTQTGLAVPIFSVILTTGLVVIRTAFWRECVWAANKSPE
jgi:hypothetical protein